MPFTIEALIDALILLLHTKNPDVKSLIAEVISIYENCSREAVSSDDDNLYELYIGLLRGILKQDIKIGDKQKTEVFLLKIKAMPELANDPEVYLNLKQILTDDSELSQDQENSLIRKTTNAVLWYKNTLCARQITNRLSRIRLTTVSADYQDQMLGEVNELCTNILNNNREAYERFFAHKDTATVTYVDFSDKDNIKRALQAYETSSVTNVFKTGWQGLNRALGGGFALGSSIVFNALAYSGKTMMLLKMLRWQITLNQPSPQFKNPTCILYSLENETPQNLRLLFREMYINRFKALPPDDWTLDQIADFCFDEASRCGWTLIIDRRLGANFGYAELVANFEEYVAHGFTPLMVVIDYMNMMKKGVNGRDNNRNDLLIRELYTNTRNYLSSKHCTLVTAHQLNRQAAEVARNTTGAVRKFDIGMLSDSTDPQREVDITFFQHKERDKKRRSWMTYKLDKDRYHPNTPDDYKYFAYMFDGDLGILDDIDGPDRSSTDINHDDTIDDMDDDLSLLSSTK